MRNSDLRLAYESAGCFLVRREALPLNISYIIQTIRINVMRLHKHLSPFARMVRLSCFIDHAPIPSKLKNPSMEGESKRLGPPKLHIIGSNHA